MVKDAEVGGTGAEEEGERAESGESLEGGLWPRGVFRGMGGRPGCGGGGEERECSRGFQQMCGAFGAKGEEEKSFPRRSGIEGPGGEEVGSALCFPCDFHARV